MHITRGIYTCALIEVLYACQTCMEALHPFLSGHQSVTSHATSRNIQLMVNSCMCEGPINNHVTQTMPWLE